MAEPVVGSPTSFRAELRDFLHFVRQPSVAPRLPRIRTAVGWLDDWFAPLNGRRLLQWALFLWAINLVFLGPIALAAAIAGGAEHRIDLDNIPWLHALLWAPLVEELVFRYGLRQLRTGLILFFPAVFALLSGPGVLSALLLGAALLLCFWPFIGGRTCWRPLSWRWRVVWTQHFGFVVHLSCLLFAAIHLHNFVLNDMPLMLMPLLVLPQWLTGLVLAWLRVRRGIGASIVLHGLFNAGPLLAVFVLVVLSGGM